MNDRLIWPSQIMAEGKSEEHSLEYQELFNEYLLIFEGKLEEFIGQPQMPGQIITRGLDYTACTG